MGNLTREEIQAATDRLDAETDQRLKTAQADVARLRAELADAKSVLVSVIDEAIGEGWSLTKVGASLGITKQRVNQLRQAERANGR